ncbi:hypothetical protein BH10ACI1_BH10ACI1_18490 [soil metagenome]
MSDKKRNILEAVVGIDYFGEANPQLADEVPYTVELFIQNKANITRLNEAGINLATATGAKLSGTRSKVARADEIENDIRLVAGTARLIEKKFPDFQNTFILPRGSLTYEQVSQYAEAFIAGAPTHRAKFTLYALNETFFTSLAAKVASLQTVSHEQADGKRTGVGANAEAEDAIKATLDTRKELDRAIKNHYRDNPQKLAEWLTASHIKRRHGNDGEGENPPTP